MAKRKCARCMALRALREMADFERGKDWSADMVRVMLGDFVLCGGLCEPCRALERTAGENLDALLCAELVHLGAM